MITVEHVNNDNKGFFKAMADGKPAGKMTYVWAGEQRIIIDHTEVDDAFAGQGIGKKLFDEAVNFARNANIKVLPLCPFAKKMFDKSPELADLL